MDFANTKWFVRDWSEEQKVQFQEKCFELGYGWSFKDNSQSVGQLDAVTYYLSKNGGITCSHFETTSRGTKPWEDMFPAPKLDVSKEIATLVFEGLAKMEEEGIKEEEERIKEEEETKQEEEESGFDNLTYLTTGAGIPVWLVGNLSDEQIAYMLAVLRNLNATYPVSVEEVRKFKYLCHDCSIGLRRTNLPIRFQSLVSFNDAFKEV